MKRLSISLKFDDPDSEFFQFIENKRTNCELTTFIVDLLTAYYENEEIHKLVDQAIYEKSPFREIHQRLYEISLEHAKQVNATDMLGNYNFNTPKEQNEPVEESKKTDNAKILALEEKVSEMAGTMGKMYEILTQGKVNVGDKAVEQVVNNTQELEIKVESKTTIEKQQEDKVVKEQNAAPIFDEDDADDVTTTSTVNEGIPNTVKSKPKSFGKLLQSVTN